MDKDTIIRMAREAGLERVVELRDDGTRTVELPHPDLLERFAALVAAAEREECAKEAELCIKTEPKVSIRAANAIAAAIRSRT